MKDVSEFKFIASAQLVGGKKKQKDSMVTLFAFDNWKNEGRKVAKSYLRREALFYFYCIPSL